MRCTVISVFLTRPTGFLSLLHEFWPGGGREECTDEINRRLEMTDGGKKKQTVSSMEEGSADTGTMITLSAGNGAATAHHKRGGEGRGDQIHSNSASKERSFVTLAKRE